MEAEVSQRLCRNCFTEELRAVAVHVQMGVEGSDVAYHGVHIIDILKDSLKVHEIADDVSHVGVAHNSVECSG